MSQPVTHDEFDAVIEEIKARQVRFAKVFATVSDQQNQATVDLTAAMVRMQNSMQKLADDIDMLNGRTGELFRSHVDHITDDDRHNGEFQAGTG